MENINETLFLMYLVDNLTKLLIEKNILTEQEVKDLAIRAKERKEKLYSNLENIIDYLKNC